MLLLAFLAVSPIVRAQGPTPKILVSLEAQTFQSIEIGSGARPAASGYADVVSLKYASEQNYLQGVKKHVSKQLKVSSIGTGYVVNATWDSGDGRFVRKSGGNGANQFPAGEVLQIAMTPAGNPMRPLKNVAGYMKDVYRSTHGVLSQELDVLYAAKPLSEEMITKLFGLGQSKMATVRFETNVQYTITPN